MAHNKTRLSQSQIRLLLSLDDRVPQHLFQYFTKNFTGGLGYTKTHLFLSLDFPLTSVTSIIFFNESSELNIDVSISCAILPLCKPHASASHFAAHRRNMVEQE